MANALGTITLADTTSVTGSGLSSQTLITGTPKVGSVVAIVVDDCSTIAVSLSGTWSATLYAEQSSDNGKTWCGVGLTPFGKTTAITSFTTNGLAYASIAGATGFRVRCDTGNFTSGTVNVNITASYAVN